MSIFRPVRALAVAAVASAAVLAGTSVASATVWYGDYTTNNVKIRTGTSQSYRILGSGNVGDHEYDYCYATGQSIYNNVFWDWNEDAYSGTTGYSSEYYLTTGTSQVTAC